MRRRRSTTTAAQPPQPPPQPPFGHGRSSASDAAAPQPPPPPRHFASPPPPPRPLRLRGHRLAAAGDLPPPPFSHPRRSAAIAAAHPPPTMRRRHFSTDAALPDVAGRWRASRSIYNGPSPPATMFPAPAAWTPRASGTIRNTFRVRSSAYPSIPAHAKWATTCSRKSPVSIPLPCTTQNALDPFSKHKSGELCLETIWSEGIDICMNTSWSQILACGLSWGCGGRGQLKCFHALENARADKRTGTSRTLRRLAGRTYKSAQLLRFRLFFLGGSWHCQWIARLRTHTYIHTRTHDRTHKHTHAHEHF